MTVAQGIFLVTALVAVLAAVMVVASPRLVHAALWLVVTLGAVAVVFVLLDAAFLAMVQVAVYIGAIAILIIFTVILTPRPGGGHPRRCWPAAAISWSRTSAPRWSTWTATSFRSRQPRYCCWRP